MGLDTLNKEPEKEEKPSVDMTDSEKHDKLNKEFQDYKAGQENEKRQAGTRLELNQAIDAFDIFKDERYKDIIPGAKAEALAIQSLSPRMTLKEAMANVVKDRMTFKKTIDAEWQEKIDKGKLVNNINSGISRGAGGVPQIDTEKKYTPEDVKNGTSRKILEELLSGGQ